MTSLRNLLLFVSLALLLTGCTVSTNQDAYPVSVTVVKKEALQPSAGAIISSMGELASRSHIRYTVKDSKGRNSFVMSSSEDFQEGQCATLWRSGSERWNIRETWYPHLAKADSNCKAIQPEPRDDGYRYRYNNPEFNGKDAYYQKYSFFLDTWLDHPLSELATSWGAPNSSIQTNEGLVVTYNHGTTTKTTYYNGYNQVTGSDSSQTWCTTSFLIVNGKIYSYNWNSNNGCR